MSKLSVFNPDLEKMLSTLYDAIMYDMNCHRVGRVIKFNKDKLTVDIELLEKFKNNQGDIKEFTTVLDCPLVIYGLPNTGLTFGDPTGAEVLLHFNDRNIDRWFETGEKYLPNTARMHHMSDGFATLSPRSLPNIIEYNLESTVLNRGINKLKINDESINILTEECEFNIDTLFELKNTAQSLADLIQEFVTACETIEVGNPASPTPLTPISMAKFTDLKTKFQGLLK